MTRTDVVVALDIGGTKALGALCTLDGTVVAQREREMGGDPGRIDPDLTTCRALVRDLLDHSAGNGLRVCALAAGFPEYVGRGRLQSHEVLAWNTQPAEMFGAMLGESMPVVIESDVRCGAIAEATRGAGRSTRSVAYVSWGTGLSWSLVIDGRVHAGERGEAIGFGELPVSPDIAARTDTLELFASGKAIERRYETVSGSPVNGARGVLRLAQQGDERARECVRSAADAVAAALAWVVALVDPAVVVLGGGIGSAGETEFVQRTTATYTRLTARRPGAPPIRPAELGAHAGLIGASLFAVAAAAG
jgi:glucokinase